MLISVIPVLSGSLQTLQISFPSVSSASPTKSSFSATGDSTAADTRRGGAVEMMSRYCSAADFFLRGCAVSVVLLLLLLLAVVVVVVVVDGLARMKVIGLRCRPEPKGRWR